MSKAAKTVKVLATPRGGYATFIDISLRAARYAGLEANEHGVVGHVYAEVAHSKDYSAEHGTEFPDRCPACGALKVHDTGMLRTTFKRSGRTQSRPAPAYTRQADYACGGGYKAKPQIQNHTDKWWGSCPAVKARIDQALAQAGIDAEA